MNPLVEEWAAAFEDLIGAARDSAEKSPQLVAAIAAIDQLAERTSSAATRPSRKPVASQG